MEDGKVVKQKVKCAGQSTLVTQKLFKEFVLSISDYPTYIYEVQGLK